MKYPFFIISSLILPAYILCNEHPIRDKSYFDEKVSGPSLYNHHPEYSYYPENFSVAPTNDIEIILPASTLQIDMSQSDHQAKVYLKPKRDRSDRALANRMETGEDLSGNPKLYHGLAYEEQRNSRQTNEDQFAGLSLEEREMVRQHRFEKQLLQERRAAEEKWWRERLERERLMGLSLEEREVLRQYHLEKERLLVKEEQERLVKNRWSNLSPEEQEVLRLYYIRQNESSLAKESSSLEEVNKTSKAFISNPTMNVDGNGQRNSQELSPLSVNEGLSSTRVDQTEVLPSQSVQPAHKNDSAPSTISPSMSDEQPVPAYKFRFVADEHDSKMDETHATTDPWNDSMTDLENSLIASNELIDSNVASSEKDSTDFFQSNAFYINKGMGEDCWSALNGDNDYSYEAVGDCQNYGQLYLSHTFGRGLGSQKGYTTLGAFFIPPMLFSHNTLSFVDVKGHYFADGKWAGSVGVGSRYLINCKTAVGINAYYDYRRFHKFDLNQIGIGFELLGSCADLRLNGYIPIGRKNFSRSHCYDYSGGYLAVFENRAFAWYGVDAEVGKWLKEPSCCNWFSLYAAAGPYYYWHNHHDQHEHHFEYYSESRREHRHVFGGRARLEAVFNELFRLSVEATYDPVWHTRVQGQIAVVVPLTDCQSLWDTIQSQANGCLACCSANRILSQPVYRNKQIVASQRSKWCWNWSTGSSYSGRPTSYSNCSSVSNSSLSCYTNSSYCVDSCEDYTEGSCY